LALQCSGQLDALNQLRTSNPLKNAFSLLLVPLLPLNQLGEDLICLRPYATASALGYASIDLRLLTRAVAYALCSAHDQIAATYPRWEQYYYNQHAKVTQLWTLQLTFWV
jgi:hypothetical protein